MWHFRGHRVSVENQLLSAGQDNKQTCVHSWGWCCDKCCWELSFFLASSKLAGTIVCHNIDRGWLMVSGQCWWLGGTESGSAGGPTRFRPTIPLNHTTHTSGLVPLLSAEFSVACFASWSTMLQEKKKSFLFTKLRHFFLVPASFLRNFVVQNFLKWKCSLQNNMLCSPTQSESRKPCFTFCLKFSRKFFGISWNMTTSSVS